MYSKHKLLVLALGLLLVLAMVPGASMAGHQFDDVPDTNIFHDDIAWMASNGITKGCNPPLNTDFCPGDNVRRETMAAFMRRLADSRAVDAGSLDGLEAVAFQSTAGATSVNAVSVGATGVEIATISGFTVPVSGGAIIGSGNATFLGDTGPDVGLLWVVIDGSCTDPAPSTAGIWQTYQSQVSETTSASTTNAVASGDHRIDLCAQGLDELTNTLAGSLTVQWVEKSQGGTTANLDGGPDLRSRIAELYGHVATR